MKKTNLSKSTLIRSIQCQKSLYLYKYYYQLRDQISREQQAKFNRGHSIGKLAHELFPNGKDVSPKSPKFYHQSIIATQYLIKLQFLTIYEAAFRYEGILVFLDILVCLEGKWYAYEVKSSKAISETYIQDAAIQYYVIQNSGLLVEDFSIIYVDENYDYDAEVNWDIHQLFHTKSVLSEIIGLQPFVKMTITQAITTLEQDTIPEIQMGDQCNHPYPCDFKGTCLKTTITNDFI